MKRLATTKDPKGPHGFTWCVEEDENFLPIALVSLTESELEFIKRLKLDHLYARRVEFDGSLILGQDRWKIRLVIDVRGCTAKELGGGVLMAYDVRQRLKGKH